MRKKGAAGGRASSTWGNRRLGKRRLDTLVSEATVDCYDEAEQRMGLFTAIQDNLQVPFRTMVLGVEVTVERADLSDAEEIVVICRRGRGRQTIPILDLPLPIPPPRGSEWIEAYRHWA